MFFLFIFMSLLILGFTVYTSRIGIEVENLIIDTERAKGEKINKDSKIYVYLVIFRKIKLFKKNIKDMKKIKFQNKDIDIKLLKNNDLKIDYRALVKNIDAYIEKINLYIQIGTQDAAITAILTGIVSAVLGIIIRKPQYEIIPIYCNKNLLKIKLDCIISVHLMQYIYKLVSNKMKEFGKGNLTKESIFSKKKVEV